MTGATTDPGPHDYELVIREQAEANRQAHRARLAKAGEVVPFGGPAELAAGRDVLADAELATGVLQARCDFLAKVDEPSRLGRHSYEPVKVIGTCRASRTDALGLAYQGLVLGEVQGRQPASGTLVRLGGRPSKVQAGRQVQGGAADRRRPAGLGEDPAGDAPPVVLNKHCPSCPFRDACLQQAEKEDNLSLLDRMTPKLMRKYHDKGIFTVRQLSHIYKPRRSRKKAKRQVRHSLELQALAIRTGKIHVEHLPELPRGPVELFVDLEGVPDRGRLLPGRAPGVQGRRGRVRVLLGGRRDRRGRDVVGPGRAAGGVPRRPRLPLRQLREEGVRHAGEAARQGRRALRPPGQRGVVRIRQGLLPGPVEWAEAAGPVPGGGLDRPAGVGTAKPGLAAQVGDDARRAVQAVPAAVQPRGLRGRPAAGRSPGPDQAGRRVGPDDRVRQPTEAARDRNREGGPRAVRADLAKSARGRPQGGESASARRARSGGRAEEAEGREGAPGLPPDRSAKASRTVSCAAQAAMSQRTTCDLVPKTERLAEKTVIDLVFTRNGCRKTVTRYVGTRAAARSASGTTTRRPSSGLAIRSLRARPSRRGPSTSGSSSACPTGSSPR